MASIIEGYEYDIFISYRQKDNKYDGWVTEFIDHLKREIEATFKEDISIYFDENPHDGLLDIHNVNKSLETKLKSLVFMPIISQTYCDPKSFAWQNEFIAFNKLAKEDQFGRDIKLASGNVCSRIIPIKIHDLDANDTELIENELECRLRSIEFIYSSAGVNRPLKPDDNPDKNLNRTYYRDQINKVANAVKEILYGLHPDEKKRITKSYQTREKTDYNEPQATPFTKKPLVKKKLSNRTMVVASIALLLLISLLFIYPGWLKRPKTETAETTETENVRKSIAILPVTNLTGNPDLQYIADGIQDDITGKLGTISSFNVRPRSSTLQFKDSNTMVQDMAKKLNVNTLVESSIKGSEGNLQIEVGLVEAFPEEKYIWRSSFVQSWEEIGAIYRDIINHIVDATKIKLTSQEAKNLSIVPKHNPEIIKACYRGREYMRRHTAEDFEKGVNSYNEAIKIDPADPLPYLGLSLGYSNAGHSSSLGEDALNKSKNYALKALELDSTLADAWVVLATHYLYTEWDFSDAKRAVIHAMKLNPNIASAHYTNGWILTLTNNVDEAVSEMKRAIEIDPTDLTSQDYLAWLYLYYGHYNEAIAEANKSFLLDPNDPLAYYLIGSSYSELGMNFEAIETHKKGLAISPGYESGLAIAYAKAGQRDKALEVVKEMEKYSDTWWYAWGLAEVYSVLGEKEKAIRNLETVYRLHGDFLPWMVSDLYFKPILNEPGFRDIVQRLNLPS
jgi:tetratricopeptide (TPR) repeat protein/TolB-like protein